MHHRPWALCLLWVMDKPALPDPGTARPRARELPALPQFDGGALMINPNSLEIPSFFGTGQEGKLCLLSSHFPFPIWRLVKKCWYK